MSPLRIFLLVAALASYAGAALAGEPAISLKQALEAAQKTTPGKVLSNELVTKDKTQAYKVKILTAQGVIKTVFVDATKGELVK